MSNIYKSGNVNYTRNYYEVKFEADDLSTEQFSAPDYQDNSENHMDLEKQRQLFNIALEKEKEQVIRDVMLKAQIEAEEIKEKIIGEARITADRLKEEAQAILNQAEEGKLAIEQEAYDNGYNKGINDSNGLVDEANRILNDITNIRQQTIDSLEKEIIVMIGNLYEKMVGIELDNSNEIIIKLIQKTLKDFALKHSIVIKVSEHDYDNVLENKSVILSQLRDIDNFEVIKSDALSKGDCVVQTNSGEIDCSISVQLEKIKHNIKNLAMME